MFVRVSDIWSLAHYSGSKKVYIYIYIYIYNLMISILSFFEMLTFAQLSRNSLPFMKLEVSLLWSQEPTTGPCHEPVPSHPISLRL
jgi:hypothetical protein